MYSQLYLPIEPFMITVHEKVCAKSLALSSVRSLDSLADLVRGRPLPGAVIRCNGEIVHSANDQIVYGRGCDVAQVNGSCIEARSFSNIDFVAADRCTSDCVPREGCRGCGRWWRHGGGRDNQRHRNCFGVPGAYLNRDGGIVGPRCSSARGDGDRQLFMGLHGSACGRYGKPGGII